MTRRVPRQQNSPKYSKSIINISSLLAFKGVVGTATYASTKAGLIGLTRAVAVESSRPVKGIRIRANAIVPGYIETKMLDGMFPSHFLKKTTPLHSSLPQSLFYNKSARLKRNINISHLFNLFFLSSLYLYPPENREVKHMP